MFEYYYDDNSEQEFEVPISDLKEFKLKYPKANKLNKRFEPSTSFIVDNSESFNFEPTPSVQTERVAAPTIEVEQQAETLLKKQELDKVFFATHQTDNPSEVRAKMYGNELFIEDISSSSGLVYDTPDLPEGYGLDMGNDYWSNSNNREEDRNTYIRIKSEEEQEAFNSKFALQEDADKAIVTAGDNYISFDDMDIVKLERDGNTKGANELREERGYVKLLNDDGSLRNYIPKEIEEKAGDVGSSNDLSVLNNMRTEKYHNLIASVKLAFENSQPGTSPNLNTLGDVSIGRQLLENIKDAFGSDTSLNDVMSIIGNINESGELLAGLHKLPSKTATARQFNKALEEFVTINRAIEINADLALLQEENFFKEVVAPTNDKTVATFKDIMEVNGFEIDDETIIRAPSDFGGGSLNVFGENAEIRDIFEGGRDVATHLAPLAASVYLTKKIPMGKTKDFGKLLDQKINILGRFAKNAGPQSRIYRNAIDLTLGGVKETIVLGLADIPAENLFGADPFVYNQKTDEFSPMFPFALGFANTAASKILNRLNTTKNLFTPMLATINRSQTAQSLLEVNIGATTGTATMFFAEEVVNLTNFSDLGYESEQEMKEDKGFKNLVETYVGMLMFQSVSPSMKQNSLSKLATGMKNDIMRAATGLNLSLIHI